MKDQPSADRPAEATGRRILHLEDSAADAELVAERLRQDGFAPEVERVDTEGAFAAALSGSAAFDLILADFSLPGFD
ncbi:MAG: histidine kinase, partial [Acetobacteraceae bacterium]|nr:histidine kinase [Acetobacteraceae bacterium]